jgi:hypothetical protein
MNYTLLVLIIFNVINGKVYAKNPFKGVVDSVSSGAKSVFNAFAGNEADTDIPETLAQKVNNQGTITSHASIQEQIRRNLEQHRQAIIDKHNQEKSAIQATTEGKKLEKSAVDGNKVTEEAAATTSTVVAITAANNATEIERNFSSKKIEVENTKEKCIPSECSTESKYVSDTCALVAKSLPAKLSQCQTRNQNSCTSACEEEHKKCLAEYEKVKSSYKSLYSNKKVKGGSSACRGWRDAITARDNLKKKEKNNPIKPADDLKNACHQHVLDLYTTIEEKINSCKADGDKANKANAAKKANATRKKTKDDLKFQHKLAEKRSNLADRSAGVVNKSSPEIQQEIDSLRNKNDNLTSTEPTDTLERDTSIQNNKLKIRSLKNAFKKRGDATKALQEFESFKYWDPQNPDLTFLDKVIDELIKTEEKKKQVVTFLERLIGQAIPPATANLGGLSKLLGSEGAKNLGGLMPRVSSLTSNFLVAPEGRIIKFGADGLMAKAAADQYKEDGDKLEERISKLNNIQQTFVSKSTGKAAQFDLESAQRAKSAGSNTTSNFKNKKFSLVDHFYGDGKTPPEVSIDGRPLFDCFRGLNGRGPCQSSKVLLKKIAKDQGRGLSAAEKDIIKTIDGTVGKKRITKSALAAIERNAGRVESSRRKLLAAHKRLNAAKVANGSAPINFVKEEQRYIKRFNKAVKRDLASTDYALPKLIKAVLNKIAGKETTKDLSSFVKKAKRYLGKSNRSNFSDSDLAQEANRSNDNASSANALKNDDPNDYDSDINVDQYEMNDNASIELDKGRSIFNIISKRYLRTFFK